MASSQQRATEAESQVEKEKQLAHEYKGQIKLLEVRVVAVARLICMELAPVLTQPMNLASSYNQQLS